MYFHVKITELSHPFWQQKGGVICGIYYIILSFRYGKYYKLFYLQMARWKQ